MTDTITVGARVTWAADPLTGIEIGYIVQPSQAELDHAATYPHAVGPDVGDVLVEWNGEVWERAWHQPGDLQVVDA
jgi:hypothetical protein